MLALAQTLLERGHEAVLACPDSFGAWVRSHGVAHRALGEDLQARMASSDGVSARSLSGMTRYFTEQMEQQAPLLLEISNGAHAIVNTGMAWMAPSIAEKLGIPALLLLPSSCLPSRLHPPPLMPWYGLPHWVNALLWRGSDAMQNRMMGRPLNAGRARLGLAPIADFTRYLFVDTPSVLAVDEDVLPPDPEWSERHPYAGFLFLDDPTPLDSALDAWLSNGEPPIYIGFGSMAGAQLSRARTWLPEAIRSLGRRCLVSAGSAGFFSGNAPPAGCYVVHEAPHAQLFPRVAVVVHHGGSGTTAAALRAGVPQVVLPVMLDQFHHAHHLARAGLAPVAPSMAKVDAEALCRAIEAALTSPGEQRRAIAAKLAARDAGGAIVERLERMVG